jgi:Tfp pilus assembly protein PilN
MNEPARRTGRRWFQLSLRSIFLLTLIVAAYFAGYRTAVRQAEQAQQAEREARLQAERSAAEAKLAEEMALCEAETQVIRAENLLIRAELQARRRAVSQIQAALLLEQIPPDREPKPELVEPREK